MALLALFRSPIFTAAPRTTPPLPLGGDVTGEAQQVLLALSFPEMIGQRPLISCSSNEGLLGTFQNLRRCWVSEREGKCMQPAPSQETM